MKDMKQKNLTGLYTFRNRTFPEWFAYSNDINGKNIPTNISGKMTSWDSSNHIFYFTLEKEVEIDNKIKIDGYCVFKSSVVVITSEWKT